MQSRMQGAPQDSGGWRKPSRSFATGNCTEVGHAAGAVLVRDTREAGQPDRTVLAFSPAAWRAFTDRLR